MRREVLCALRRRTRLQQPGRLPVLRGNGHRAHGGQEHPRTRREPDHRRGSGRTVELADVVADDGRMPRDGRADGRALPRTDGQGKGDRVRRPRRKKAYPVPRKKFGRGDRARLYLLQCRLYGGKRPLESKGRERHEAGGALSETAALPRLRRDAPQRKGARAESARHFPRRGLPHDAGGTHEMGGRRTREPAGGDAADGGEHLRLFPHGGKTPGRSGARIPHARPRRLHPLHGRAAANAARARRAQPHDGRIVCARRAVYRAASLQHRRARRRHARPRRRRELRRAGRPRYADPVRLRPYHRNGPGPRRNCSRRARSACLRARSTR